MWVLTLGHPAPLAVALGTQAVKFIHRVRPVAFPTSMRSLLGVKLLPLVTRPVLLQRAPRLAEVQNPIYMRWAEVPLEVKHRSLIPRDAFRLKATPLYIVPELLTVRQNTPLLALRELLASRVTVLESPVHPAAAAPPAGRMLVPSVALAGMIMLDIVHRFPLLVRYVSRLQIVNLWKCTRLFWPATLGHPAVLAALAERPGTQAVIFMHPVDPVLFPNRKPSLAILTPLPEVIKPVLLHSAVNLADVQNPI